MPIRLMPILYTVLAVLGAGALWYVVDEIGDRREAKVRGEFAEAARKKNVEIGEFNANDESAAAILERVLAATEAKARGVPGSCPATQEQASALTAIRRAR